MERLRDVLPVVLSGASRGLGLVRLRARRSACVAQPAPAGLVLVQVTHHGPAEHTGLSETVPLGKERLHDAGNEPWGHTQQRLDFLLFRLVWDSRVCADSPV